VIAAIAADERHLLPLDGVAGGSADPDALDQENRGVEGASMLPAEEAGALQTANTRSLDEAAPHPGCPSGGAGTSRPTTSET
jgi:hypothetical protein